MGSPTLSRGPSGPHEDAGVGIQGGGDRHRSSSSSRRLPRSSIVVVVIGHWRSSSRPRCHRHRHRNGTAHWPSPEMTTSSCVVRVVRPRVALVVGRHGCCCADAPLVSAGGHSEVATHLRWVVGTPPTQLEPCPPSSISSSSSPSSRPLANLAWVRINPQFSARG